MGDLNAADLGHAYHEDILKSGGCMQDGEVLQYWKPLPRGGVYEGVYIDDHLVVAETTKALLNTPSGRDADILEYSRSVYDAAKLPRGADKCFDFAPTFYQLGHGSAL